MNEDEEFVRAMFPQFDIYKMIASPEFGRLMQTAQATRDQVAYKAITGMEWTPAPPSP